ncbi:MAG: hypothetical protein IJ876_06160 [Elusimicrobiaceae bacterium]|nr:hypothetical protein [Elusimicrobiaceae bacterium]
MKRLCLFAGFHPKGQISEYVVHYVRALSQVADVYYWADCDMPQQELDKLLPYVRSARAQRHGKYDFGSWQALIYQLGWEFVAKYEECLFVNDSVFGPIFPLENVFQKSDAQPQLGAWALNSFEGTHFGSFFFALRPPVLLSTGFKQFIEQIAPQQDVGDVIRLYEKKLPQLVQEAGANYKVLNNRIPSVFNDWKSAVRDRWPVLKIQPFTRKTLYADRQWLPGWRTFLKKHTDYPVELIESHLRSVGIDPDLFDTPSFWIKSVWWALQRGRRKAFRIHFHKQERICILFGITLLNTEPSGKHLVAEL